MFMTPPPPRGHAPPPGRGPHGGGDDTLRLRAASTPLAKTIQHYIRLFLVGHQAAEELTCLTVLSMADTLLFII